MTVNSGMHRGSASGTATRVVDEVCVLVSLSCVPRVAETLRSIRQPGRPEGALANRDGAEWKMRHISHLPSLLSRFRLSLLLVLQSSLDDCPVSPIGTLVRVRLWCSSLSN